MLERFGITYEVSHHSGIGDTPVPERLLEPNALKVINGTKTVELCISAFGEGKSGNMVTVRIPFEGLSLLLNHINSQELKRAIERRLGLKE